MASPALLGAPKSSSSLSSSAAAIKDLSSSGGLSSLPSRLYASKEYSDLEIPVVDGEEIPAIDFSLLTKGTPDQRSQTVRDLGKACRDWGFFSVVNHGVPESLMKATMDALKEFFDLTAEEKAEYADTHVLNPIRYGTSFNTAVEDVRYWRDYLKVITHPESQFPAKPPGFSEIAKEYTRCTRELARELLKSILESVGVEESSMKEALGLEKCWQIFVGNLYPPCPQPELAIGLPSHSDHGLLTILYTNGVDGLEVKHNGKWTRVKALSNSFLVNTGDHVEIVTNGRYKSVLHRAMVNGRSLRMSIACAIGPSMDAVVAPAPQLVTDESPAAFQGLKFEEYVERQQSTRLKDKSVLDSLRL